MKLIASRTAPLFAVMSALALSLAAGACHPTPTATPVATDIVEVATDAGPARVELATTTDGGVEPFDVGDGYAVPACANACAMLQRLGCPEGVGRPGEDSCYVVCKRAETTRGRIDLKPSCVSAARTKDDVRSCGTYRCLEQPGEKR